MSSSKILHIVLTILSVICLASTSPFDWDGRPASHAAAAFASSSRLTPSILPRKDGASDDPDPKPVDKLPNVHIIWPPKNGSSPPLANHQIESLQKYYSSDGQFLGVCPLPNSFRTGRRPWRSYNKARDFIARSTSKTKLIKRVWSVPEDPSRYKDWLLSELKETELLPHGTWDGDSREVPSALGRPLRDYVERIGVVELWGCTSVIVVSSKAAWISHFWESPHFTRTPTIPHGGTDEIFEGEVIRALRHGCEFFPLGCQYKLRDPGLYAWSRDHFDADSKPTVFILTPMSPEGETYQGDDPMRGLLYEEKIYRLRNEVRWLFPGAELKIHPYKIAGSDPEIQNAMMVDRIDHPWGKALIRYDPDVFNGYDNAPQVASLEVWFEQSAQPIFQSSWVPHPIQTVERQIPNPATYIPPQVAYPIATRRSLPDAQGLEPASPLQKPLPSAARQTGSPGAQ